MARRLAKENPGSFYVNQYFNTDNVEAYYRTLGPELWEETGGGIDIFVAGAGTGGTFSGTGRYTIEFDLPAAYVASDLDLELRDQLGLLPKPTAAKEKPKKDAAKK